MTEVARPKSAFPTYNFPKSGIMARPAGVPGMYGPTGASMAGFTYGVPLPKATGLRDHALKRHSPYAATAVQGYSGYGKEASIKPKASQVGAGVVSAGSIDNTYIPAPLTNAWGKARERSKNEIIKVPHKQATDLIIVAKGAALPAPPQALSELESVRPIYSRTIPVYHPMDPMRVESGFVRSPNLIPGAKPPPVSALVGVSETPVVPNNHKLLKLAYDQSMNLTGRIPVARVVRAKGAEVRPQSATPYFLSRPAGLPGGLSLIEP